MPANCSLTYGNTDWQHIGNVTVKSDNWDDITSAPYDGITVYWDTENDLYLMNERGDTIRFESVLEHHGTRVDSGTVELTEDATVGFYFRVSDWSNAVEGTTYKKTVTYRVSLHES